jgi:hypothetical protein
MNSLFPNRPGLPVLSCPVLPHEEWDLYLWGDNPTWVIASMPSWWLVPATGFDYFSKPTWSWRLQAERYFHCTLGATWSSTLNPTNFGLYWEVAKTLFFRILASPVCVIFVLKVTHGCTQNQPASVGSGLEEFVICIFALYKRCVIMSPGSDQLFYYASELGVFCGRYQTFLAPTGPSSLILKALVELRSRPTCSASGRQSL